MSENITVLNLDDREQWESEHRQGGLPAQSWDYAFGLSASGIEPKLAIVRSKGARMMMSFFERSFMGTTDIATTPGLSGASIEPVSNAPLSLWHEYATAQGWVAGYIQLAPFIEFAEASPHWDIVDHNGVLILDLRVPDLLAASSRIIRRKVREAEQSGAVLLEDKDVLAEGLVRLHPIAMRLLASTEHYSPETLDRWARDASSVGFAARIGDQVEAVYFARVAGRFAEAHLAPTNESGRGLAAWLTWTTMVRLQQMGIHTINLGGGAQVGDGVYRYKQRYNPVPIPLRSVRQIYDRRRYDELCEGVGNVSQNNWFPAYRAKPLPVGAE